MERGAVDVASKRGGDAEWLLPSEALTRSPPHSSASPADVDEKVTRVRYGVRIAGLGLLIGSKTGAEVVFPLPLAAMPNSPEWLLGIINLRGNLLPVIDLYAALDLAGAR